MSRYLVIGGGGLIGRHIGKSLAGRDVTATDHNGLDVTSEEAVRHLISDLVPDVVILAAAEAWVERCEREPAATRQVNVDSARVVAESAAAVGAMFVVFSSEYVFDGTRGVYVETDDIRPINEYGRQKVQLEQLARALPRHLICRTSGVFGNDPRRRNFVLQVVDALRSGHSFMVPSDQVITPTYAPSLARALVELLELGTCGTFHVVGPEVLQRPEFARRIARAFGLHAELLQPVPTAALGLAAHRPPQAGLSDAKLRRIIGHALTDVDDALGELAAQAGVS